MVDECVCPNTPFRTNKATTEDLERNNQRYQKKNVAVLSYGEKEVQYWIII